MTTVRSVLLLSLISWAAWAVLVAGSTSMDDYRHQVKNKLRSKGMEFSTMETRRHNSSLNLGTQWETIRHDVKETSVRAQMVDAVMITYPIRQVEVGLMLRWEKYKRSTGLERAETLEQIRAILSERARVDMQVKMIVVLLFGSQDADSIVYDRDHLLPGTDDLSDCITSKILFFERHCGRLSVYGMKHENAFANICKRVVETEAFEQAVIDTCGFKNITKEDHRDSFVFFSGLM